MNSEELLRYLIEIVHEMILIFDRTGVIRYANPSAKRHLEFKQELCGCRIEDILPGEFLWTQDGTILPKELEKPVYEVVAYRENKTCFPAKAIFREYRDVNGLSCYLCCAYNYTNESFLIKKMNQAGQELEAAQKIKSEFVANVTHELRTPVNGISGNTRELLSIETDKEKRKRLELIEHGCNDMHTLINGILDFSKLEAGKFTLEPMEFDFREMMEYIRENHSSHILEKGLDFTITISPQVPGHVIGDKLRIQQILNNLISNAYKFTSVGEIHIEVIQTARNENRVELFFMVMDTGIGIPKDKQDKLFQSFMQVDASISRRYGGTGLGLNISRQLAELMGGGIHVESEENKGSTFSFHIWLDLPKEETERKNVTQTANDVDTSALLKKLQNVMESREDNKAWVYGTTENKEEIKKKMTKLILSVEMENWEKAEMFAETLKKLTADAPKELQMAILRLKMAVQKGDYSKTTEAFERVQDLVI